MAKAASIVPVGVMLILHLLLIVGQASLQPAANETTRIAGGNETAIEKYPYVVSVREGWPTDVHICGGSIIAHHWVLTAAYCVQGNLTDMYMIRAGSTRVDEGTKYALEQIIIHPKYRGGDISSYDIAVVKVVTAFIFSSSVEPVKLAPAGTVLAVNTEATVAGFGATPPGQEAAEELLAVTVPVVSGYECSTAYGSSFNEDAMLCVNHGNMQQGACVNDEGSALVKDSVQIGVVSFTTACYEGPANRGPGMYTRVSYFRDWISTQTRA